MARLAQVRYTVGSAEFRARDAEVVAWYRKAAEQGHLESQVMLGEIYGRGLGVREDPAEALKWFRRAADQGDPGSLSTLAWHYRDPGPNQDLVASYALDTVAGERDPRYRQGEPKAASDMSEEQIEAARALADRLRAPGAVLSKELKRR
jgi:TPR repeat protein